MTSPSFTVNGNRLRLLTEGPERLATLLALVREAQKSLRLLYYIFVDDDAGHALREALIAAVGRGVKVTLVVDGLGSEPAALRHFFEPLVAAGVGFSRFEPWLGRRYLVRNHQKLALADESRALVGGFNMQDSYFGTIEQGAWRDLGLLVEGPAAVHLAGYFDTLAAWTRQHRPPLQSLRRALVLWSQREGALRWLFSGTMLRSPWFRAVTRDIDHMTRHGGRFDLISAYFSPNPAMLRRLDRAGEHGRMRLITPSRAEHPIAVWAARFSYAGLLRKQVRVFEYQPTRLHSKLYLIDDVVYIGSANCDIRSLYLNLELMLRIEDRDFAAHVRAYIDGEIAASQEITPDLYRRRVTPWRRLKQMIAWFVMTVLDYTITSRLNFFPESAMPDEK